MLLRTCRGRLTYAPRNTSLFTTKAPLPAALATPSPPPTTTINCVRVFTLSGPRGFLSITTSARWRVAA